MVVLGQNFLNQCINITRLVISLNWILPDGNLWSELQFYIWYSIWWSQKKICCSNATTGNYIWWIWKLILVDNRKYHQVRMKWMWVCYDSGTGQVISGAPPCFKSWGGPNRFPRGGVVDEVREFEGGGSWWSFPARFRGGVVDEVREFEGGDSWWSFFPARFRGGGVDAVREFEGRGSWWNFPARFFIFSVRNFGGVPSGSHGGSHRGSHVKIPKVGGSNVPIPKVGGVRTPPTRAVAAPMGYLESDDSWMSMYRYSWQLLIIICQRQCLLHLLMTSGSVVYPLTNDLIIAHKPLI